MAGIPTINLMGGLWHIHITNQKWYFFLGSWLFHTEVAPLWQDGRSNSPEPAEDPTGPMVTPFRGHGQWLRETHIDGYRWWKSHHEHIDFLWRNSRGSSIFRFLVYLRVQRNSRPIFSKILMATIQSVDHEVKLMLCKQQWIQWYSLESKYALDSSSRRIITFVSCFLWSFVSLWAGYPPWDRPSREKWDCGEWRPSSSIDILGLSFGHGKSPFEK